MRELDQIAEEQQLRQQVRNREHFNRIIDDINTYEMYYLRKKSFI